MCRRASSGLVAPAREIARTRRQQPGRGAVATSAHAVTDGAALTIGRGVGGGRQHHRKAQGGAHDHQPQRTERGQYPAAAWPLNVMRARGAGDQAIAVVGDIALDQSYCTPAPNEPRVGDQSPTLTKNVDRDLTSRRLRARPARW
jgi:hypothetical protein